MSDDVIDRLAGIGPGSGRAAARGPFGAYPPGPLSAEDSAGTVHRADATALDARLVAALDHARMLLFHPRDASPQWLQRLMLSLGEPAPLPGG